MLAGVCHSLPPHSQWYERQKQLRRPRRIEPNVDNENGEKCCFGWTPLEPMNNVFGIVRECLIVSMRGDGRAPVTPAAHRTVPFSVQPKQIGEWTKANMSEQRNNEREGEREGKREREGGGRWIRRKGSWNAETRTKQRDPLNMRCAGGHRRVYRGDTAIAMRTHRNTYRVREGKRHSKRKINWICFAKTKVLFVFSFSLNASYPCDFRSVYPCRAAPLRLCVRELASICRHSIERRTRVSHIYRVQCQVNEK